MEKSNTYLLYFISILLVVVLFGFLANYSGKISESNDVQGVNFENLEIVLSNNGTENILQEIPRDDFEAKVYNQTWLDFDGINDNVQIADRTNFTQSFSVSFWFKKPLTNDQDGIFLSKKYNNTHNTSWEFDSNTGNDMRFRVFVNTSKPTQLTSSLDLNFISANTWYHVVGTYNTTAIQLYTDGVLQDTDSLISGTEISNFPMNISLGMWMESVTHYNGSLDEIRVYNISLTSTQILEIYNSGRTRNQFPINQFYSDDFSSYIVGNDTTKPNWIPQYTGFLNITSDGIILSNYLIETNGDRDIHITLNKTDKIQDKIQNITMNWDYNTTDCNSSYFDTEGVSNIASSGYLFYNNTAGDDFLSVEFKTFANVTGCFAGDAQISMFKRVNGVSTALIPFTQYVFAFNQTYQVKLTVEQLNSTNYNYTMYLDGILIRSTINISTSEIKDGSFLLENAGTKTYFDNFNITGGAEERYQILYLPMNENQGTTTYDKGSLGINGSIVGASYNNDGIEKTLIDETDYTQTENIFTIINDEYSWTQTRLSYAFGENFGFQVPILRLIAGFIALIAFIFVAMIVLKIYKEVD